jgi:SAM-dependent methyltransferase
MSGFSAEWLGLREPVDHGARATGVAARVRAAFAGHSEVVVVDLGCGTGSNLRATFELLPPEQIWTLIDYDLQLLMAARATLSRWADQATASGDQLILNKGSRRLKVAFRQVDLNLDLDTALDVGTGKACDLVTASAFFDLCSSAFMERMAHVVAQRKAKFYTVLTYNGEQSWTPAHPADAEMVAAFHHHQRNDKGFGPAAGPDSAAALARAFQAAGYRVHEGDSPWKLGVSEQRLVDDLAHGFAGAVAETQQVSAPAIGVWRSLRRTGARVGHTDTFAELI